MDVVRPPYQRPQLAQSFQPPQQPEPPPPPSPPPYGDEMNDGMRMVDPNTGQPLQTELDQVGMPPMNDWLRATYQVLLWASESLKSLAQNTPALANLSPDIERTMDQIATLGYQVTNAGAEATRALWNWPYSRVIINKQIEQFIHPKEWGTFDVLYAEWVSTFVVPAEQGKQFKSEEVEAWVKGKEEIADPKAFLQLCVARLRTEQAAGKSAWTPTDMLALQRPVGRRQTTTTDLHKVFRRKPG